MIDSGNSNILDVGRILGRELPGLHAFGAVYRFGERTKELAQAFNIFALYSTNVTLWDEQNVTGPQNQERRIFYALKQHLWLCGANLNYTELLASVIVVSDLEPLCANGLETITKNLGLSQPENLGTLTLNNNHVQAELRSTGTDAYLAQYTRQMLKDVFEKQSRIRRIAIVDSIDDVKPFDGSTNNSS